MELKELYVEVANLTKEHCEKTCRRMGSCCSPEYCEMAIEIAAEDGVLLARQEGRLPLFKDGVCMAAPHHRPMCSFHQCDIDGVGYFKGDDARTKKYFTLREEISEKEVALYLSKEAT